MPTCPLCSLDFTPPHAHGFQRTRPERMYLVDPEDQARTEVHGWTLNRTTGYWYRKVRTPNGRVTVYLHEFIMGRPAGVGMVWDHINRDPSDNRKGNLRAIMRGVNAWANAQRYQMEVPPCP